MMTKSLVAALVAIFCCVAYVTAELPDGPEVHKEAHEAMTKGLRFWQKKVGDVEEDDIKLPEGDTMRAHTASAFARGSKFWKGLAGESTGKESAHHGAQVPESAHQTYQDSLGFWREKADNKHEDDPKIHPGGVPQKVQVPESEHKSYQDSLGFWQGKVENEHGDDPETHPGGVPHEVQVPEGEH